MRSSLLPIWIVLCLVFCSCKDNVVCPAFQSTYILDDSIRLAKYSLFLNDSTPKFAMASRRTKYGVSRKTSLFRKNYDLKTAPKVNIFGEPTVDELEIDKGDFLVADFVDTDSLGVDSLGVDSVIVAPAFAVAEDTGPRYKYRYRVDDDFNQEQAYYNKYYGELFVDNRPPPPTPEDLAAQRAAEEAEMASDTTGAQTQKRGLFKKRNKEEAVAPEDESEIDLDTLEEADVPENSQIEDPVEESLPETEEVPEEATEEDLPQVEEESEDE